MASSLASRITLVFAVKAHLPVSSCKKIKYGIDINKKAIIVRMEKDSNFIAFTFLKLYNTNIMRNKIK